jgi:hypothetical protein
VGMHAQIVFAHAVVISASESAILAAIGIPGVCALPWVWYAMLHRVGTVGSDCGPSARRLSNISIASRSQVMRGRAWRLANG